MFSCDLRIDTRNSRQECLFQTHRCAKTYANASFLPINPNENLTGVVTGSGGTPTLRMQILDGHGIDGEVLTKASVGQKLTLDVELKNAGWT
ncbi:unnamed protein product [Anisakis simplex]|uniref:Plastocyanin-like domain-containing protein n=1 Tax=Anisakis simplex TaxID=6269 RepID=A0A0M3JGH5_ANISI|nr:unnamed protein product [Anisakis simplex]